MFLLKVYMILKQWLRIITAACGTYDNALFVFIMWERQIILFIYWGNSVSSDVLYS
jgi:hypothetical protein